MRTVSRYWFLAASKLMSMRWEWTDCCPYGATDGRTLFLNRRGLDKLAAQPNGTGLIAFLLVHESLHALLGHGWRLIPFKDKEVGNIAADYIINALIAARNKELRREVFPFISGVLLDEQLSGDKSVEELYRELIKPQAKPKQTPSNEPDDTEPDNSPNDATDDNSSDTPADGNPDGDDRVDGPDSGDPCDGSGSVGRGVGADDDLSDFVGMGTPDNLAPEVDELAGETLSGVTDQIEESNERILVADAIDRATSGESGDTGKRVRDQRVVSRTLDWCDLLREWMLQHKNAGWMSPFNHVVHISTGLVCAGRRSRAAGVVVLVLDSSGSIGSTTYTKFLQQAQSILDELKPEQLVLLSVSHCVADSVILEQGDQVPDRLNGGGGTRFKPAFEWLGVHDIQPDVMVYLTDGWSDDLRALAEPDFPLLWLSTSRDRRDFQVGEVLEIGEF